MYIPVAIAYPVLKETIFYLKGNAFEETKICAATSPDKIFLIKILSPANLFITASSSKLPWFQYRSKNSVTVYFHFLHVDYYHDWQWEPQLLLHAGICQIHTREGFRP